MGSDADKSEMRNERIITVAVHFDAEAGVWVATSRDVAGLAVEGADLDSLRENVLAAIPVLIELNGLPRGSDAGGRRPAGSGRSLGIRLDILDHLALGGRTALC